MDLLVSDFDGTFFDVNYIKNIEFIKENKSLDFVIATGRNFISLKKDLKIKCKYYICNDGGYILDSNYKLIYRNYIKENIVKIIYSRIKELGYIEYFFDNVETINKNIVDNVNKISIKIKENNVKKDIEYLLNGLSDVYAYISTNWINIINIDSKKSKAIDFILNFNNYDNIYVIGNDVNDIDMLRKYNGYLINNGKNDNFKTINSFLDLKQIIKND